VTESEKRDRADSIARVLYGLVYDNRDHLVRAVGIVSVGYDGAVHTHFVCDDPDVVKLLVGAELLRTQILAAPPRTDPSRTHEEPDGA
jgi:hypothetical protein